MKKNKLMRAASALLIAVLLTTCAVSGTFAKYVTADDASDSARVAKFGVVVTADGSLFEKSYINEPEADANTATVVSSGTAGVVAPGTNSASGTFKFSIKGQPEVDVKVDVIVTETENDVFLKAKNGLPKMTTGDEADTFDLGTDYYPVKYKLTKQGNVVVENATLAQLETALEAISKEKVDANTNLATEFGEYEISWAWAIDGDNDADTLLGDLAAETELTPNITLTDGTDYNLSTGLKVTITVTQID